MNDKSMCRRSLCRVEAARLRRDLLAVVRGRGGAQDQSVAEALLAVPRHLFVPGVAVEEAYQDEAIVTKRDGDGLPISSSSQPTIMALMLDQLGVAPGHRVLEIGAGTGYNAALLAHLVGPSGGVVSIDIDPQVTEGAMARLAHAGYPQVQVVCGDGAHGHATVAPYDRIIATVGVWDLAPAWLHQLAPGGRIVVPLDLRGAQVSVAFERDGERWVSRSVIPCGFMRLRGEFAGAGKVHVLDRASGLRLAVPDERDVGNRSVSAALAGPAVVHETGVSGLRLDAYGGLAVWLAVTEPRSCALSDEGSGSAALEPALMQSQGFRATSGILDGARVAVLAGRAVGDGLVEVETHGYGPGGDRLAADLAAHVRAWDAAGRPGAARLRIAAYARDTPTPGNGIVIAKAHTRLVVSFVGVGVDSAGI
jgi:protein-L-isoaspartate(D-aspartate) O-methyltransferase